ncbi:MAG TPA: PIN domain-containing protein, partial [Stenomitos sp.]
MQKVFVLDTNVLLHDPGALFRFEDNDVVLPITIIEELDRFKKLTEMTGRNARQVSRSLDHLRQQGHLIDGIPLENGGTIKVALCHQETLKELPVELEGDQNDNAILAVALEVKRQSNCNVVLVSKDTNLRIKADVLGISAEDYETDKVDISDLYTGTADVYVSTEAIAQLFKQGGLPLEGNFYPNQAITLIDSANPSHTALAIVSGTQGVAMPISKLPHNGVSRIQARNREQQFALDLLMKDSVSLVTLVGKAGTGKTLLA